MSRRCTICDHPERTSIEKELISGTTLRQIAKLYSVARSSLHRHKQDHLARVLAKAFTAETTSENPAEPSGSQDPELADHEIEVVRHRQEVEAKETQGALDVVGQLRAINAASLEVLKQARSEGKHGMLLRAVDRITKQIELQAKLLGDIQDGQTVNIAVLPEWHGIRQTIIDALRPHPEAGVAVARALKDAGF